MNDNLSIGAKIKELRTNKKYTLKQLSEETGLSIGFLSQLERGLSSIAVDSLLKIAKVFEVELSSFFADSKSDVKTDVVRSYEIAPTFLKPHLIYYAHTGRANGLEMLPRVFRLLPHADSACSHEEMYNHSGEEFIYVLEGILTLILGHKQYELYPGDSVHIKSNTDHKWINRTSREVCILTVNTSTASSLIGPQSESVAGI